MLQFVTSFSSGAFLRPLWLVPDSASQSMLNIANSPWTIRLNILVDMVTAMGIIFLGAMLFLTLRKQSEKIALTGLGLYILEAVLLAASRMAAFSLLGISQAYAAGGNAADLQVQWNLSLASMDFAGSTLHMLAFSCGGILFYYLLNRSRIVPRPLSLWGLITVIPCLAGTLLSIFGTPVPILVYIPYMPFELVIGIWILIKGVKEAAQTAPQAVLKGEAA